MTNRMRLVVAHVALLALCVGLLGCCVGPKTLASVNRMTEAQEQSRVSAKSGTNGRLGAQESYWAVESVESQVENGRLGTVTPEAAIARLPGMRLPKGGAAQVPAFALAGRGTNEVAVYYASHILVYGKKGAADFEHFKSCYAVLPDDHPSKPTERETRVGHMVLMQGSGEGFTMWPSRIYFQLNGITYEIADTEEASRPTPVDELVGAAESMRWVVSHDPCAGPTERRTRMRLKPQHKMMAIVAVIIGVALFFVATSGLPGTRSQEGDVVTKVISSADGNATASFGVTLLEGGDAEHEASHIFESLQNEAIESAALDTKALTVEVRYDASRIAEADVRQLLVTAGYVQPAAADATAATIASDGKSQELAVEVGEGLDPSLIRAKAGVPLTLKFGPGTGHLASISIAELGIQQSLTDGASVVIENPRSGTYSIICAEGVADGTLIVE